MTSDARSFFNRWIFRSMLFGCGLIAIGMYRFSSDKTLAWRFAKARALTADDIRPFDERAAGMIPGEGCGFLILARDDRRGGARDTHLRGR